MPNDIEIGSYGDTFSFLDDCYRDALAIATLTPVCDTCSI